MPEVEPPDFVDEAARSRARARRIQALTAVQREVMIRLIGAGLVFILVLVAAAWFLVVPMGRHSTGELASVLQRFIELGADDEIVAARLLLSNQGLRAIGEVELGEAAADKSIWNKSAKVRIDSATFGRDAIGNDQAEVAATLLYPDFEPATLGATMLYEDRSWRISRLTVRRAAP